MNVAEVLHDLIDAVAGRKNVVPGRADELHAAVADHFNEPAASAPLSDSDAALLADLQAKQAKADAAADAAATAASTPAAPVAF
jgi:hypothetical protein